MHEVGFEPTKHYALQLKCNPFDHSGIHACAIIGFFFVLSLIIRDYTYLPFTTPIYASISPSSILFRLYMFGGELGGELGGVRGDIDGDLG